jgi:phage/plasmid-associated DNA primase
VRDDPDSMERLTNKVKGIVLYTEYKKWCVDNGERCYSNTKFGITISTVLQKLRSNGVYYIL